MASDIQRELSPLFLNLGRKIDALSAGLASLQPEVKLNPTFTVPDITVPPIQVPEIKIPDFPEIPVPEVSVTIPEIRIPEITVPEPQVMVNVDEVNIRNIDEFPRIPETLPEDIARELQKIMPGGSSGPTEYKGGEAYGSQGVFGNVALWEDVGSVLRTISAAHPLPVDIQDASVTVDLSEADIEIGAVELKDGDSDTRADIEADGAKNALFVQSESLAKESGGNLATLASVIVGEFDEAPAEIHGMQIMAANSADYSPMALLATSGRLLVDFYGTYTEGAEDASITGVPALWEDTGNILRPVSADKPLPVDIKASVLPAGAATAANQQTDALTNTELRATAVPVSLASVPSHPVTNAGTFATQVDGSALTALQKIDNQEDEIAYTTVAKSTTDGDIIATPGSGHHLRIHHISVNNHGANFTKFSIRNGSAGTILRDFGLAPEGGVVEANFKRPVGLSANTALYYDYESGASADVSITVHYEDITD